MAPVNIVSAQHGWRAHQSPIFSKRFLFGRICESAMSEYNNRLHYRGKLFSGRRPGANVRIFAKRSANLRFGNLVEDLNLIRQARELVAKMA
jgi:hypothetical protein